MFCDIRSFTTIAEAREPAETIELLNDYYTLMMDAIGGEGGIVNQIIGDGLMAIFGALIPREDRRVRAVRAAWQMVELIPLFNAEQAAQGRLEIQIGVGIASGRSSPVHRDAAPCDVHLRRRHRQPRGPARGANKVRPAHLIDENTRAGLGDESAVEPQGELPLKGKRQPVNVYAVDVDSLVAESVEGSASIHRLACSRGGVVDRLGRRSAPWGGAQVPESARRDACRARAEPAHWRPDERRAVHRRPRQRSRAIVRRLAPSRRQQLRRIDPPCQVGDRVHRAARQTPVFPIFDEQRRVRTVNGKPLPEEWYPPDSSPGGVLPAPRPRARPVVGPGRLVRRPHRPQRQGALRRPARRIPGADEGADAGRRTAVAPSRDGLSRSTGPH